MSRADPWEDRKCDRCGGVGKWGCTCLPSIRDRPAAMTAEQLKTIIRDWLEADDATHFGAFEKALARAIEL